MVAPYVGSLGTGEIPIYIFFVAVKIISVLCSRQSGKPRIPHCHLWGDCVGGRHCRTAAAGDTCKVCVGNGGIFFLKRIGVIWEISRKLPDTVREAEAVNVSIRDGIIRTRVTRW